MEFNKRVVSAYPEIFGEVAREGALQGTDAEGGYQSNWGGYDEVYCLAQGDILKFDEVTELPLHQCYMYLANNRAKNKLEIDRIKNRR